MDMVDKDDFTGLKVEHEDDFNDEVAALFSGVEHLSKEVGFEALGWITRENVMRLRDRVVQLQDTLTDINKYLDSVIE